MPVLIVVPALPPEALEEPDPAPRLAVYRQRPDKDWSLTAYISFVGMLANGLTDALTGDRYFEPAGFRALLRTPPSTATNSA
jgi:hypothetical protein